MSPRATRFFIAVMILAVAAPGLLPARWQRDSFPLSFYPMFSRNPPQVQEMTLLQWRDGDGRERAIVPAEIGMRPGVRRLHVVTRRAAEADPPTRQALCAAVAARLPPQTGGEVQLVVAQIRSAQLREDAPLPVERRDVVARCSFGPPAKAEALR